LKTYTCISGDSHVQIKAEAYADRVPEKFRDQLPKRIKLPNGGDGTVSPDGKVTFGSTGHYAGHTPENFDPRIAHWDDEAGWGSPEQRLKEQDIDGVDAEILYTFVGRSGGRDPEMAKAVIYAYNSYLAEEFCGYAPDRLLGIGLLPHTGVVGDDIAEMEHIKKLGLRGVVVYSYPNGARYPTPEDDRFWAAALDMDMPVSVHTAMNLPRAPFGEFSIKYPIEPEGYDRPPICVVDRMSRYGTTHCGCLELTQMIMTGLFDRFPKLNNDPIGVELRHHVGVDHVMWGSDFPHEVTRWPESQKMLSEHMAGVPEDEKRKMLGENIKKFFHLAQLECVDL